MLFESRSRKNRKFPAIVNLKVIGVGAQELFQMFVHGCIFIFASLGTFI